MVLSGSVDVDWYAARKLAGDRLWSTGNQNDERECEELSIHCLQYMAHVAQWTWGVHYSSARRSSWAFRATITVLADIRTAANAGGRRIPREAKRPAASGMALML